MSTTSRVKQIIVEEYAKVVHKLQVMVGVVAPPDLYIPELDEEYWRERFFPEGGKQKVHGEISRVIDTGEIIIICNTWIYVRYFNEFSEIDMRKMVSVFLCHEITHHLNPEWLEIDVNVAGEKLFRLIYPS